MEPVFIIIGLSFLLAPAQAAPYGPCYVGGSYTYDDQDCHTYYICSARRQWIRHSCGTGLSYNPLRMRCVDASTYNCPYPTNTLDDEACTADSCLNGGTCTTRGTCQCAGGFVGERCETATTCSVLHCYHGGRCHQDNPSLARCYCRTGYTGPQCDHSLEDDGTCPVSEEQRCDPTCENGGRCFLDGTEPTCFCAEGFAGEHCETVLDACASIECENQGQCVEENGVGVCQCEDTFSGDRCQLRVSAACAALQCQNNAPCRMVGRSTVCDCPEGFTGDRCQYEDFCPNITCLHGGSCETGPQGQAFCNCNPGYTGSFCEIALDCEGFICYNGGTCRIENNVARVCDCPERTSGELCQKKLQCHGNGTAPCQNGGQCHNSEDGFICACPIGRKGLYCEELRTCNENVVCENGGTCEDDPDNGATCNCAAGFQGPRCDVAEDDCGGCQNGGVCELPSIMPANSPASAKVCACPANFDGEHCETETACTIPCPELAGAGGERYHIFVYPDTVNRDYVYLCREGRLSHFQFCDDGLWYDPFAFDCHNQNSFTQARLTAGNALFPRLIPASP